MNKTDEAKRRGASGAPVMPQIRQNMPDASKAQEWPSHAPIPPQEASYQQDGLPVPMQRFVLPQKPQRTIEQIKQDMLDLQQAMQVQLDLQRQEEEKQATLSCSSEVPVKVETEPKRIEESEDLDSLDEGKEEERLFDEEFSSLEARFNNPKRRKKIEDSLAKMNVEDLFNKGELEQTVPICGGKVNVIFRTTTAAEGQAVLSKVSSLEGSTLYIREAFDLMRVALGVKAVGGKMLPNHLDKDGDFNSEAFDIKYSAILKYPQLILADIRVNYAWFDDRVQRIMIAEELGNG